MVLQVSKTQLNYPIKTIKDKNETKKKYHKGTIYIVYV